MRFRRFCRATALAMAVLMFLVSGPLPTAQAAMVSTEEVVAADTARADRHRVMDFLSRSDVRAEMRGLGVDPKEAEARVQALSDAEVARIAGKLEEAKAGQGAVESLIGAALVVFLVLLITDLLCLTSVFSFTKCGRD